MEETSYHCAVCGINIDGSDWKSHARSCHKKAETVNHPAHYGGENNPYEAIKVIEAWMLNFNLGNAIKYISRVGKKANDLEDLKKAKWYIEREISKYTKGETKL